MDNHNLRLAHPCVFCKGWAPRICPPWDFWSADGVEGHVPRTLALGSIVPILDQERQGWGRRVGHINVESITRALFEY
jgi:hypothetical protein